jgi:hypothetical protein
MSRKIKITCNLKSNYISCCCEVVKQSNALFSSSATSKLVTLIRSSKHMLMKNSLHNVMRIIRLRLDNVVLSKQSLITN